MEDETTFGLSSSALFSFFPSSSFGLSSPSPPSPPTSLSRQGALRDAEPHDAEAPARGAAGVEVEWRRRVAARAAVGVGADVEAEAPLVGTGASGVPDDARAPTPVPQRKGSVGCRIAKSAGRCVRARAQERESAREWRGKWRVRERASFSFLLLLLPLSPLPTSSSSSLFTFFSSVKAGSLEAKAFASSSLSLLQSCRAAGA